MKTLIFTLLFSTSAFAANTYKCELTGEFDYRDSTYSVSETDIQVKVGETTLVKGTHIDHETREVSQPDWASWSIKIKSLAAQKMTNKFGKEHLVLSVLSPEPDSVEIAAYSALNAKYIGSSSNIDLETESIVEIACEKL